MIAYKGFNSELQSIHGNGINETCQFFPGETKKVPHSKTVREGFHCCEYPFDCLGYYDLNGSNRFFKVEAYGDIDEDDKGRIACTEIKLIKELDTLGIVAEVVDYITAHPHREGWEVSRHNVSFQRDSARINEKGIVMVRGKKELTVNAPAGTICAFFWESPLGYILTAGAWYMPASWAGRWVRPEEFIKEEREGRR